LLYWCKGTNADAAGDLQKLALGEFEKHEDGDEAGREGVASARRKTEDNAWGKKGNDARLPIYI
jgi:hypothetical protein